MPSTKEIVPEYGLSTQVMSAITQCFTQNSRVQEVVLYGSRAKGNFREASDIDLTIKGDLTLLDLAQIENALDDLLLPVKIDLSLFHQIRNQDLLDHIKRVGVTIYRRAATA